MCPPWTSGAPKRLAGIGLIHARLQHLDMLIINTFLIHGNPQYHNACQSSTPSQYMPFANTFMVCANLLHLHNKFQSSTTLWYMAIINTFIMHVNLQQLNNSCQSASPSEHEAILSTKIKHANLQHVNHTCKPSTP